MPLYKLRRPFWVGARFYPRGSVVELEEGVAAPRYATQIEEIVVDLDEIGLEELEEEEEDEE